MSSFVGGQRKDFCLWPTHTVFYPVLSQRSYGVGLHNALLLLDDSLSLGEQRAHNASKTETFAYFRPLSKTNKERFPPLSPARLFDIQCHGTKLHLLAQTRSSPISTQALRPSDQHDNYTDYLGLWPLLRPSLNLLRVRKGSDRNRNQRLLVPGRNR